MRFGRRAAVSNMGSAVHRVPLKGTPDALGQNEDWQASGRCPGIGQSADHQ